MKSQKIKIRVKIIRAHLRRDCGSFTKFNGKPSESCENISRWIKCSQLAGVYIHNPVQINMIEHCLLDTELSALFIFVSRYRDLKTD